MTGNVVFFGGKIIGRANLIEGKFETIVVNHESCGAEEIVLKGTVCFESLDDLRGGKGRLWTNGALNGHRKNPLDEVMMCFKLFF